MSIGRFNGGVGMYDMSNGSGVLAAKAQPYLIVGEQGTGTLLVGGSSTVKANAISLAHDGGTGTLAQTSGAVNARGRFLRREQCRRHGDVASSMAACWLPGSVPRVFRHGHVQLQRWHTHRCPQRGVPARPHRGHRAGRWGGYRQQRLRYHHCPASAARCGRPGNRLAA